MQPLSWWDLKVADAVSRTGCFSVFYTLENRVIWVFLPRSDSTCVFVSWWILESWNYQESLTAAGLCFFLSWWLDFMLDVGVMKHQRNESRPLSFCPCDTQFLWLNWTKLSDWSIRCSLLTDLRSKLSDFWRPSCPCFCLHLDYRSGRLHACLFTPLSWLMETRPQRRLKNRMREIHQQFLFLAALKHLFSLLSPAVMSVCQIQCEY